MKYLRTFVVLKIPGSAGFCLKEGLIYLIVPSSGPITFLSSPVEYKYSTVGLIDGDELMTDDERRENHRRRRG